MNEILLSLYGFLNEFARVMRRCLCIEVRNRHKEERVSRYRTRIEKASEEYRLVWIVHVSVDNKTRYNGLCTISANRYPIITYVRVCIFRGIKRKNEIPVYEKNSVTCL